MIILLLRVSLVILLSSEYLIELMAVYLVLQMSLYVFDLMLSSCHTELMINHAVHGEDDCAV